MAGTVKGVYVQEKDLPLWERAQRAAGAQRLAMASYVLIALEEKLERDGDPVT